VCAHVQTRQQSICVRHEDVVDNTTTWLVDLQQQFGLATKPGFPIEVIYMQSVNVPQPPVASLQLAVDLTWPQAVISLGGKSPCPTLRA
jgi:hypothetical protein